MFYFNETYVGGDITNGSIAFPFHNFSEFFQISFTNSIELVLLSDLTCKGSFFNDFGLTLKLFFKINVFLNKLLHRSSGSAFPYKFMVDEYCIILSSNCSLIFQNIDITFLKTLSETLFKIFRKGYLSFEVYII